MSIKIDLRTEFFESLSDYCNDDFTMKVGFKPNMERSWIRFSYY